MPPRALFGRYQEDVPDRITPSLSLGIQLIEIWKSFQPEVPVLQGASLRMDRGELAVVEGPTGSGKTTLLRLVAAIERPDSGRVAVGGVELTGAGPSVIAQTRRTMGLLLPGMPLLPWLTVADNVTLALRAVQTPIRERRVRVYEVLKSLGLEGRRGDYPNRLSAGEAHCVAVARALVARPSVVLADEPTALMDRRTAGLVLGALKALHTRGATVLVASSDPDVAPRMGARRLQVRSGRLEAMPAARKNAG